MLQSIRNRFKGGFAVAVLIIIAVPFVLFFGAESFFFNRDPNILLVVNDESLTTYQLDERQNLHYQSLRSQYGDQIDNLPEERLRRAALDLLITETINRQSMSAAGLNVSDEQIKLYLSNAPQFQQDGSFSRTVLNQYLQSTGQSQAELKKLLQEDIRTSQVTDAFLQGISLPRNQLGALAALLNEKRSFNAAFIRLEGMQGDYSPDESAQRAWFEKNQDLYQHPEYRTMHYISLSLEMLTAQITLSDEQVRAEYERIVERARDSQGIRASGIVLTYGETRTKDEAQALGQKITEQIKAGEAFAGLVKQYSDDIVSAEKGGDLGWSNQGGLYPDSFLQALQDKQIGDLTEADTGDALVLLRLEEQGESNLPAFAELSEQIRSSLAESQARAQYDEQYQLLQQYAYEYTDINEVAGQLGLAVITSTPYALDASRNESYGKDSKVLEALFDMESGQMLEVPLDLSSDEVLLLQLHEQIPAKPMTFAEAQDQVKNSLTEQHGVNERDGVLAQAEDLLRQGRSFTQMTSELGLQWENQSQQGRTQAPEDYAEVVFNLAEPDADQPTYTSQVLDSGDAVIIELTEVIREDPAEITSLDSAAELERAREIYAQAMLEMRQRVIYEHAEIEAAPGQEPDESN